MEDTRPFGVKLTIAFLLLDAAEKAGRIGLMMWRPDRYGSPHILGETLGEALGHGIVVAFCLLLAAQLLLGTNFGRIWAALYFSAASGLTIAYLAFLDPGHWVELGPTGRALQVATVAIDLSFAAYLVSSRARAALAS